MHRLVLVVLLLVASSARADGPELVVGRTVTSTRTDAQRDAVVVVLAGPAPTFEVMRAEVKQAQARQLALEPELHTGVVLEFPESGLVATSLWRDGRFVTEVGNGATMLRDAADAPIAATPSAKIPSFAAAGWSRTTKVTCDGTVKNTSSAPIEVAARCTILGKFHPTARGGKPLPMVLHVMGTRVEPVGLIAPGKSKRYKLVVTDLTGPGDLSFEPVTYNFLGMSFKTGFVAGGAEVLYFDAVEQRAWRSWLDLVREVHTAGLRLRPAESHGGGFLELDVTPAFLAITPARQRATALALAKRLDARYRKVFGAAPVWIRLHDGATELGSYANGAYQAR